MRWRSSRSSRQSRRCRRRESPTAAEHPPKAPRGRSGWRDPRALLGIGISLVFLALLLARVDRHELQSAIANVDVIWLLLALAVYAVALWVRGMRWQLVLRPHVRLSSFEATSLLIIGYAANNVLPARAGELVRAALLQRRHGTPWSTGLGAIVVERALDGVVLALFLSGTVLLAGGNGLMRSVAAIGTAGFLFALVVLYAVALAGDRGSTLITRLVRLVPGRIGERGAGWVGGFLEGFTVLRDPVLGGGLLVTTVATWALESMAYWFVGEGFGLELSPLIYLGVCGAANLALVVPSTAGGVGPFEFAMREVTVAFGAASAAATAHALVVHALVWLPVSLAGALLLWRQQLGFGALVAARAEKTALEDQPVAARVEG